MTGEELLRFCRLSEDKPNRGVLIKSDDRIGVVIYSDKTSINDLVAFWSDGTRSFVTNCEVLIEDLFDIRFPFFQVVSRELLDMIMKKMWSSRWSRTAMYDDPYLEEWTEPNPTWKKHKNGNEAVKAYLKKIISSI